MEDANKLTSVHDALQNAVLESGTKTEMINCTFKVPPHVKDLAEKICDRHGTTMSVFLRECVKGLVRDYNWGPTEQ
jgi:hypothetical protein